MTQTEKEDWLVQKYPLTIVRDRYNGVYSGGRFTCWPLPYHAIPREADGRDMECQRFWDYYDKSEVGVGNTVEKAVKDLERKFERQKIVDEVY